jgi:hypothetical protein
MEVIMKRITLFTIVLVLANWANAETHIPGGNISGVWDLAGSPFYIEGNCVITSTSTLTIEPGVEVLMEPWTRIRCEGQLLAIGTETDSIHVTATDTIQGCESLDFLNTNSSPMDSSKLVYCKISYGAASSAPDMYMHGGGLYLKNSSRILISHSTITNCRTQNVAGVNGAPGLTGQPGEDVESGCGGAIYCKSSSPLITNNIICYSRTGDAIGGNGGDAYSGYSTCYDGGAGGDAFAGNGGAIYLYNSYAIICDNTLFHNHTGNGYGGNGGNGGDASGYYQTATGGDGGEAGDGFGGRGGIIYSDSSQSVLSNNLFYKNSTGSGYSFWGINPGTAGQGGNGYGGCGYAVDATDNSYNSINNCTITDHHPASAGQGGSGGFNGNSGNPGTPGSGFNGTHVLCGNNLEISNSIVWNNADPGISDNATVTYSCVQDGHAGQGNIFQDPLFVLVSLDNFCLSQISSGQAQQSPCIDAGDPATSMITGTTRTDGLQDEGVVDMGYHYPLYTQQPEITLTMTPHDPPIIIPSGGGSFNFEPVYLYHRFLDIYHSAGWNALSHFSTRKHHITNGRDCIASRPRPIYSRNSITRSLYL